MTKAWREWSGGRRRVLAAAVTVATAGGLALAAEPAQAAALCVGSGGGCYPSIQAAVDAAHNGDTITIRAGIFAGGVTITKSVRLQGAGPRSTIIRGGSHVLTIGAYGAASEPTVSISGVTVTGGLARSSPESVPLFGKAGAWAAGGGTSVPSGISCPGGFPQGQCPFAPANGGGIDSWGALTLIRTAVTGNSAGAGPGQPGTTSDADGGGIFSRQGSLTLDHAIVSGNRATATSPAGRFAEAGGIWAGVPEFEPGGDSGHDVLVIRDSVISGNTASLSTDFPTVFGGQVQNLLANAGGVLVAGRTPATTIENTVISTNTAIATDPHGEAGALDAGLNVTAGTLDMSGSVVSGNRAITRTGTSEGVGFAGGALEADGGGTISDTRITGNFASVDSPHSAAGVAGALGVFGNDSLLTVRASAITGNTAIARSSTGSADVQGAGVFNDGLLTLADDTVSGNSGTATGPSGTAQGGGIWNGADFTGPPVQLTLEHTAVTRNSLTGSHGIKVQGGGLFSAPPATVVLRNSLITLNIPDQCSGC